MNTPDDPSPPLPAIPKDIVDVTVDLSHAAPQSAEFEKEFIERELAARELLAGATRDACALTGQTISPEAVQLAAEIVNAIERTTGVESDVPHATLFHICEMAVRLEGKPALDIAGAMVSLTRKLLETHAKPARSKLPKWRG